MESFKNVHAIPHVQKEAEGQKLDISSIIEAKVSKLVEAKIAELLGT